MSGGADAARGVQGVGGGLPGAGGRPAVGDPPQGRNRRGGRGVPAGVRPVLALPDVPPRATAEGAQAGVPAVDRRGRGRPAAGGGAAADALRGSRGDSLRGPAGGRAGDRQPARLERGDGPPAVPLPDAGVVRPDGPGVPGADAGGDTGGPGLRGVQDVGGVKPRGGGAARPIASNNSFSCQSNTVRRSKSTLPSCTRPTTAGVPVRSRAANSDSLRPA